MPQPRIYQYVTQDGVIFWSFTKLSVVSYGTRMTLDSREGTPMSQYISDLRGLGRVLGLSEEQEQEEP